MFASGFGRTDCGWGMPTHGETPPNLALLPMDLVTQTVDEGCPPMGRQLPTWLFELLFFDFEKFSQLHHHYVSFQSVGFYYASSTRRHGLHSQSVLQPWSRAHLRKASPMLDALVISCRKEWGYTSGKVSLLKSKCLPSFPNTEAVSSSVLQAIFELNGELQKLPTITTYIRSLVHLTALLQFHQRVTNIARNSRG